MIAGVVEIENETENTTEKGQEVMELRCSGRTMRLLKRYEVNIVVPETNNEDPNSYEDTMKDTDQEK